MLSALILAVISLLFLSGCDVSYTQEELDAKIAEIEAGKDTEYQGQLDALIEQLDTLQNNVDDLNTAITEKDDKIEDLEGQLAAEEEAEETELAGEEMVVGLGGNLKATIKDNDLDKLFDGEVEFDGDDFDAEEIIKFANSFEILTSARDDAEFSSEAYLGATAREAISYKFQLNDLVDKVLIDTDNKLEIPFLGTDISIVNVINKGEITILLGEEVYLDSGETITISGKVVTLVKTGTNGAVIDVDSVQEVITVGTTEKVNGIEIHVVEIFNDDGIEYDSASLIVGEDIQETIASGDDFELFGECEDCFWVWDINIGNSNQYVGILSNEIQDDLDRDFPPVKAGESIFLPNDYVEINFKEVTDVDYMDIELSFDKVYADDDLATDLDAVILTASSADGFVFQNGDESDEVYIGLDGGVVVYYLDEDNKIKDGTGMNLKVINDDFELSLTANLFGPVVEIKMGDIAIYTRPASAQLGANAEEAETQEVQYDGIQIGTRDYDVLCDDGVIIEDLENNGDNDEVMLKIPSEEVEATVIVK